MATVTIVTSDPAELRPRTIFVPLHGTGTSSATAASFRLENDLLGVTGVDGRLNGTGFAFSPGDPNGLPIAGLITSIDILRDQTFGDTLFYTIVFATPIDALTFRSTNFDLTTLLYGGGDSMLGAIGNDWLAAHGGNDTMAGGSGDDTLDGGAGSDSLFGQGSNDSLLGGAGTDILDGGTGNDTLRGNDDADTLSGASGDDELRGDAGHDLLRPGSGQDSVYGSTGNDTILISDIVGPAEVLGGADTDTLVVNVSGGFGIADLTETTLATLEVLRIELGTPALTVAQLAAFTTVQLSTGAGSITGILLMDGGSINLQALDMPQTTAAGLTVTLFNSGTATPGFAIGGRYSGAFINDNILGSGRADSIGGANGHDTLWGGAGADTLNGGFDHDSLSGGADNDQVNGGSGNDTVQGGAGSDTLTGSSGADRFRYAAEDLLVTSAQDWIMDFTRSAGDRIDLSAVDANVNSGGDQAFGAPIPLSGGAAPPPVGSLRYEVFAGYTMVYAYNDSDAAADLALRVVGAGYTPVASDFIL